MDNRPILGFTHLVDHMSAHTRFDLARYLGNIWYASRQNNSVSVNMSASASASASANAPVRECMSA